MIPLFSSKDCPYNNECIATYYRTRYESFVAAKITLFQYIEGWYNRTQIHGAIDFLTLNDCERLCQDAEPLVESGKNCIKSTLTYYFR